MSGKHAYLIMCHSNFRILEKLIGAIDDPRNDIYIHIDKKTVQAEQIKNCIKPKYSNVSYVDRIDVAWGGFSQIQAEILLMKAATKTYHDYYHLISGVDLPLKSQDEIHAFFDAKPKREYIQIDTISEHGAEFEERLRYYRFLQDRIGRNAGIRVALLEKIEQLSLAAQKKLGVNRMRQGGKVYKGPNWFSITHDMAKYILSKEDEISRKYRYCLCADEIFLQTTAMQSPFKGNIANDCLRMIDRDRGTPYIFTSDDFQSLIQSKQLFARKFDETVDFQIVERLYNYVTAWKESH